MNGSMNVELIRENPDGSADYMFNMTEELRNALTRYGIIKALEEAIQEARSEYTPEENNENSKESIVNSIINMLMLQHEATQDRHNYWLCAANLIRAEYLEKREEPLK